MEDNGIPSPTNVVRLYHALADVDNNGRKQLKYYHPGLGGEDTGLKDKLTDGALGININHHICSAYFWLAKHYENDDEIIVYGFSRGAFTVRSLSGMLKYGLLDLRKVKNKEAWKRVDKAFKKYQKGDSTWVTNSDWQFYHKGDTPIYFVGVWDTVGALGIPDNYAVLNLLDVGKYQFHDTSLGEHIKHARHAMALDEKRSSFTVCRWNNIASFDSNDSRSAKEVWFPGVHSDVGGGYADCDLSNGSLQWMIEESYDCGLAFRQKVLPTIKSNPLGVMHESHKGFMAAIMRSRPRNIPAITKANEEAIHPSVFARQKVSPLEHPAYFPVRTLTVGDKITLDIFAKEYWNMTHLYLKEGQQYYFSGEGEWVDGKNSCEWTGTEDDNFTAGDVARKVSSIWGKFERLWPFKKNHSTDFLMTKRVESMPWFTTVGAIANDSGKIKAKGSNYIDGSPHPHQYIELSKYSNKVKAFTVTNPGYLYCFANDVWRYYDNNKGSIQLTIHRAA